MAIGLWKGDIWIALFYSVVTAVVLYLVLRYARKTWLELGEAAITGKVPEGKKKK